MMKLSLMTLNMMLPFGFRYMTDQDAAKFEYSWTKMMDLVQQAGFNTVDITSLEIDALGEEKLIHCLAERNLKVSSLIYMHNFAEADKPLLDVTLKDIREKMDLAVRLDIRVFMLALVALGPGKPEGMTREEVHAALRAYFTPASVYANSIGLYVVIENTPDLRFYLNRAEDLRQMVESVPGLRVVYDSGNMLLSGEDPAAYYRQFAPFIAHIHLKDMRICSPDTQYVDQAIDGTRMTAAPAGTGLVDMRSVISAAKESGYDGYLTVEFASHPEQSCLQSLFYSREYYERILNELVC